MKIIIDHVPNALMNFEPRYGMAYRVEGEEEHYLLVGRDEQGLFYRETDHVHGLISQKYPLECRPEYDFSGILHHFTA